MKDAASSGQPKLGSDSCKLGHDACYGTLSSWGPALYSQASNEPPGVRRAFKSSDSSGRLAVEQFSFVYESDAASKFCSTCRHCCSSACALFRQEGGVCADSGT